MKRLLGTGLLLLATASQANVEQLLQEGDKRLRAEVKHQQQVDRVAADTQTMLREFEQLSRDVHGLESYQRLLQQQLDDQLQRIQALQSSLQQVADMEREILPLSANMIATLRDFVALDMPFLQAEREQRLQQLEQLLGRTDVSTAEKFRQVMEAYQIEVEYGRTLEAYRADLQLEGQLHRLNFLRIGRVALMYLSDDGQQLGHWNSKQQAWQSLPADQARHIRRGLQVARKQLAPTLLPLPLALKEVSL